MQLGLFRGFLRALFALKSSRFVRFEGLKKWRMPVLTVADGRVRCVACHLCSAVCPTQCIDLQAGPDPTGQQERYPQYFSIDLNNCIDCSLCVRACPEDALHMEERASLAQQSLADGRGINLFTADKKPL